MSNEQDISLSVSDRAMAILAMTPQSEKGSPRGIRRLIRIRKNLIREMDALNKELRRHKPMVKILK